MDFKSLLNKLDSMEAPVVTPAAPKIPEAVQLNEDAQLRVLSGRSTYVAEAKKKAEEKKDEKVKEGFPTVADAKAKADKEKTTGKFDKKQTSTGTVYTRKSNTFTDGGDDADTKKAKKKAKSESIDPAAFRSKFEQMVEAKKEESEADVKKQKEEKKKKIAKIVDEGKKPDDDGDGVPNWADKKPGEDDNAGKKKGAPAGKKGMSAKQEKFFGKKKTVKESVEPKLSFKQMIKLVQESGGQQAIDPTDKELFAWATRVAQNKFVNEGMKAEVYAGLVYERMGGVFEMYDILSEGSEGDYLRPGGDVKMSSQDQEKDQARQEKAMISKFKASGQPVKPGSQIYALMKKHNEL